MASYLIEVRNHTRKQIFVVALPRLVDIRERLQRFHLKDTPGWDYVGDDIDFLELAGSVMRSSTVALFVTAYAKARKVPGWRVLAAASLRAEQARRRAVSGKKRRTATAGRR